MYFDTSLKTSHPAKRLVRTNQSQVSVDVFFWEPLFLEQDFFEKRNAGKRGDGRE